MTDTPADLGPSGTALWESVAGVFDLVEHERALLLQACRVTDTCDRLSAASVSGPVVDAEGRLSPVLGELRAQQVTLSRLLASLRVPDEDDVRAQHRGASRAPYLVSGP